MKNISINNDPLELNVGKQYYIIDALYLTEIKSEFIKAKILPEDIRNEVFPYTDTPFALFRPNERNFYIDQITKVNYEDVILEDCSFFSTDSGLIVFVAEDIFAEFLNDFNYEDLVDSGIELINETYWKKIVSKFKLADAALVLADSEKDFDGSGTYRITMKSS